MKQDQKIFEWGDPDKETILLLHGLGSSGLSFGELATYLVDYHIVAFHLPSHGGLDPLESGTGYRPTEMVTAIHSFIEERGLMDFYLAGHSWGAHLALYYAAHFPENVKGVLLLDGGYLTMEEDSLDKELEMVEKFYENFSFPSIQEFLQSEKEELGRWSAELEVASLSQVVEAGGKIRLATSIFTAQSVIKGMCAEPAESVFSKIASPVRLLRGTVPEEMEPMRHSAVKNMKKQIPHLDVRALNGVGHDLYRDDPKLVAQEIREGIGGKSND
jgi:pimeloyl-ACP methyl ester carboxylesterase